MGGDVRVLDSRKMFVSRIDGFKQYEFADKQHSVRVTLTVGDEVSLNVGASHYVVVFDGEFEVLLKSGLHHLSRDCFGSFPGEASIKGNGRALILSSIGYESPVLTGGPIEEQGRLRYIDGCTASILLPPQVRGEPCLNFMHLPRQISQTMHTHPSLRAGIVLSGNGRCETPHGVVEFRSGSVFLIPPNLPHSFQSGDETLRIVIFHPDSDSGPTHTDHTMLNRTFIEGRSAQVLANLHTRHGGRQ